MARGASSRGTGAFGWGRAASLAATRALTDRSRSVVIKARGSSREDRHHFRFIVAPEDAAELSDMKVFTRDIMADAERDLALASTGSPSITRTPGIPTSMYPRAHGR
jgi:hypothetical protein